MKICLTFSAGGHYTEIRRIMDAFEGHDIFFATIKAKSTKKLKHAYYLKNDGGAPKILVILYMVINTFHSLRIILKEKPSLIVSTGANVTLPICILGRIFRKKVIFIESICRVNDLSFSGKVIYFFADLFLVQWEQLLNRYNRAKYWGSVL
jgi:UDP-N-acetylglucosamine:LPS N-acetylglucosamine transferase